MLRGVLVSCVCIIPARGGSTRIKDKNIRLFHGKPIIVYSIETAQKSGIFDRIIVSTDSEDIAIVARHYGAEVIMRSTEMSRNEVGTQDVMAEVLKDIDCDYACCLYATAPMLEASTLKRALINLKDQDDDLVEFVVPCATWLQDPGQFYFGKRLAFSSEDLLSYFTRLLPIDSNTECDINTEEDWLKAEKMYAELHSLYVGKITWIHKEYREIK